MMNAYVTLLFVSMCVLSCVSIIFVIPIAGNLTLVDLVTTHTLDGATTNDHCTACERFQAVTNLHG